MKDPDAGMPGRGSTDPLWYKDAIIYELHVRAFADSNGDGIGDFAGLTAKLDYLQDLGVNTLWLLPFYPSPLKDDGYDIADYTRVHPDYGTLSDFRAFLREAHRRGLRVITELVLNHTSDQHPWFVRARQSPPGSRWRNWYVWSDTSDRYRNARIIFKDFEPSNWSWDPVAKSYFWHRFYAHQPDLNYDNPEVHKAMFQVVDFWLGMGVDGFRLDAVTYLYEREGTSCDNLPETHDFLRKLRKYVDDRYPGRVLLAEANLWPEDAVAYFGRGDECNMAFHFPIMARMFLAVHQEDRFPMVDILAQTPTLPETAQWALFLRNHDELTLEMVTDEERDYMHRVYAREREARINLGIRRRLAPLLGNNRKKMELLNALLFSLPGTPVIYYGDEIGMGDNIFLGDRNGVRTPMQWSGDRNAGFSRANAQRLYFPVVVDPEYHYEATNVEAQQANPHSLFWWMKRLLALSRRWKAFGRGSIELLAPENRKVLAFIRRYEDEVILVVANLSRFAQYVELDLGAYAGRVPVELFGHSEFPRVGEAPYLLTLGPHAFYWFGLQQAQETSTALRIQIVSRPLEVSGSWRSVFEGKVRQELERALQLSLPGRGWFPARSRRTKLVRISDVLPLTELGVDGALVLMEVDFHEGEPELFSFPLQFLSGAAAEKVKKEAPGDVIAELKVRTEAAPLEGILVDGLQDPQLVRTLADLPGRRTPLRLGSGKLLGLASPLPAPAAGASQVALAASPGKDGPHQTSFGLGNGLTLTWLRRLEEGPHPDVEASRILGACDPLPPIVPLAGHLEYQRKGKAPITLAILRRQLSGATDAWSYTLDALGRYFETIRSTPGALESLALKPKPTALSLGMAPPAELESLLGHHLESARILGERTASLHKSLMESDAGAGFTPEPFTPSDQRSIYQTLRKTATRVLPLLRRGPKLPTPASITDAKRVSLLEGRLLQAFQTILKKPLASVRIRCHGDLGLHHILSTGSDFVVADWSGLPTRSFLERRIKRSPIGDAAAMLNSFRRAANAALLAEEASGEVAPDRWPILELGASAWVASMRNSFLRSYVQAMAMGRDRLGPAEEVEHLLRIHLLEKVLEDLGSALGAKPAAGQAVRRDLHDLVEILDLFRPLSPGAADSAEAAEWAAFVKSVTGPPGPTPSSPLPGPPPAAGAAPTASPPPQAP
ncbi:MAG: maltose alpha-D-glucosyltransferase [Planctomycetota bacterium]|nr:MAG: maltose alpha-D-glucosyltransferase [Planctomycetota bacterium]